MAMISAVQLANAIKGIPRDPPRGTSGPQWIALARGEAGPAGSSNYDINAPLFNTTARNPRPCSSDGHHANGVFQFCENTLSKEKANELFSAIYEAFALYERRGWQPWAASHSPSTSDRRAWDAATGSSNVDITDPGEVLDAAGALVSDPMELIAAALKPIKDMVKMVADAASWIGDPQNWVRIVQVGGGVVLALVAASIVAKPVIEDAKRTVSPF
jgi:hypothetical protein